MSGTSIGFTALTVLALQSGFASADTSARDLRLSLFADGSIFDQAPFDGLGDEDGVSDSTGGVATVLNSGILEIRGVMEFDLSTIPQHRGIRSAVLRLTPIGTAIPPGTAVIPVQVMGFFGDGILGPDDFQEGRFVAVFNGLGTPLNTPVGIDVTEFVRVARASHQRFVGFSVRHNQHGAEVLFGSRELGPAPILTIATGP
jgi:hypothetical protein